MSSTLTVGIEPEPSQAGQVSRRGALPHSRQGPVGTGETMTVSPSHTRGFIECPRGLMVAGFPEASVCMAWCAQFSGKLSVMARFDCARVTILTRLPHEGDHDGRDERPEQYQPDKAGRSPD